MVPAVRKCSNWRSSGRKASLVGSEQLHEEFINSLMISCPERLFRHLSTAHRERHFRQHAFQRIFFSFFSLRRVRGFEKEIHRFNRAKERIGLEGGKGEGFNAANFSASQVLCRLSLQLALFLPVPNDF